MSYPSIEGGEVGGRGLSEVGDGGVGARAFDHGLRADAAAPGTVASTLSEEVQVSRHERRHLQRRKHNGCMDWHAQFVELDIRFAHKTSVKFRVHSGFQGGKSLTFPDQNMVFQTKE